MRARLSLLMFLVYAPIGASWPLFTRHLDALGFTPLEIARVCAMQALAGIVGPILVGQIADRWLAPERCLAIGGFLAGMVFLLIPTCLTPGTMMLTTLAFWLVMTPSMMLCNAIGFAHLPTPEKEFGPIRLWGTVGWVVQGWVVGYALGHPQWLGGIVARIRPATPHPVLADSFHIAAGLAFLFGIYAFTIPPTRPRREATTLFAPLLALRMLKQRPFAIFFLCTTILSITFPFSTQNTPLLLKHLGIGDAWAGPLLTTAQSTEIVTLGLLPWILGRWGLKSVLLLGTAAWAISLSVQALGQPVELVVGCLSLNGLFITCFIVAGQVCVNTRAGSEFRASAQALIAFSAALGQLLGYLLSGVVRHAARGEFGPTFGVAMLLAWLAFVILAVGFRHETELNPSASEAE